MLSGKPPTAAQINAVAAGFVRMATGRRVVHQEHAPALPRPAARRPAPPPPPPPPPDPMIEHRKQVAAARKALGLAASVVLSKAMLERKRRELARKHHPDLGGSAAKMQEINQAVDFLLETVDN